MMKSFIFFMCIILSISVFILSCELNTETESDPTPSPTPEGTLDPEITPAPTTDPTETPTPAPTPYTPVISPETADSELFTIFSITLSASGSDLGSGVTYHWSISGGGSLDTIEGDTVVYTAPSMSDSVTISCFAEDDSTQAESDAASIDYTIFSMDDSVLWLDAMASGTLDPMNENPLVNGMAIEGWEDRSGNGNDAAYLSGGYPTYWTEVINDRAAIRFHDSSAAISFPFLNIPDNGSLFAMENMMLFVVAQQSETTETNNQTIISMAHTETLGFDLGADAANTTFSLTLRNGASTGSVTFPNTAFYQTPAVIAGLYDASVGEERLALWADEVLTSDAMFSGGLNFTSDLYIGGYGTGTGDGSFHGYIGEIVMFDKIVSDEQMVFIQQYLRGKWGMAVSKNYWDIYRLLRNY